MGAANLGIMVVVQLAIIVIACRALGWAARRWFGQPQVVGEILAGILLGPSLFGAVAPDAQAWLFPEASRGLLHVIAQIGIGLAMFVVGLGFDPAHFRTHARSASAVSLAGIAAPFLVALLMTPWLLQAPGLFREGIAPWQATLFLGACIAITAFPVLARIIEERQLTNTPLGALTLSSGAIDDVCAWTILAIVLASFGAGAGLALKTIVGGALLIAFMLRVAPRLLAPLANAAAREGVGPLAFGVVLGGFLLSAFVADTIGLHAVFGGFIFGATLPRGFLAQDLRRRLEPVCRLLLVPVFFCVSGLSTELSVMIEGRYLLIGLALLAASILAKFGACWAAARATGQANDTALAIGALMNARGLMELVILNIGLERGIIAPPLFAILVLMTLVTTLMATPLFEWTYGRRARARGELGDLEDRDVPDGASIEAK